MPRHVSMSSASASVSKPRRTYSRKIRRCTIGVRDRARSAFRSAAGRKRSASASSSFSRAGTPTVLFSGSDYRASIFHRQYDVTPDGDRFIFIRRVRANQESRLILVQDLSVEHYLGVGHQVRAREA